MASLIDSFPGYGFIPLVTIAGYGGGRGYKRTGFMDREDIDERSSKDTCPWCGVNPKAKVKGTDKNASYCEVCIRDRSRNRYRVSRGLKAEVTCPSCGDLHSDTNDAGLLRVRCDPCNEKIDNATAA